MVDRTSTTSGSRFGLAHQDAPGDSRFDDANLGPTTRRSLPMRVRLVGGQRV